MSQAAATFEKLNLPRVLIADLRSDHAGQSGAVEIYRGITLHARHPEQLAFAKAHLATEQKHLNFFSQWLPTKHHSRLLPMWRWAGRSIGMFAGWLGPQYTYYTIDACETFVRRLFDRQIKRLSQIPKTESLQKILSDFQFEEISHRDEARDLQDQIPGVTIRAWQAFVRFGAWASVNLARLI